MNGARAASGAGPMSAPLLVLDGVSRHYRLPRQRLFQPAPRRTALVDGQNPFAIVLACSDSRAPVELIFDQGLGDLFVIRVAGNVVAPSQIGSIEYALDALDVRLVVVLGHSWCGAVAAALDPDREAEAYTLAKAMLTGEDAFGMSFIEAFRAGELS